MEFIKVDKDRKKYIDLLLLADEQESMIDKYLYSKSGDMFVLFDEGIKAECVVAKREEGVYEIKNIAVLPEFQRKGYGKALILYISDFYKDIKTLYAGTGDSPATIPFYIKCGFKEEYRIKDFFTNNYDHPIYECGKRLRDMVMLRKDI